MYELKDITSLSTTEQQVDLFESLSMPEIIYPRNENFFLDDLKFNRELYSRLIKKRSKIFLDIKVPLENGKYQELIETGLGENGYIYFATDESIKYLVRYKKERVSLIDKFAVTQFLVWADRNFSRSRGLATKVFFDFLLKKHKIIVSDYEQTLDGKRFWQNRIGDAFDRNLHVYLLDSRHNKVHKIKDEVDLDTNYTQHWREDKLGKFYRFAISESPLTER